MIDWDAFSWEAFATLVTGVVAVAAAFVVGRRQLTIHEQQTRLQELELRSDLFDRRYAVYEKVRQFLLYIMQHAQYPELELEQSFLTAMGESKFLFGDKVQGALQEIWKRALAYRVLKVEMARIYQAEGHYGDGNPQREFDATSWLSSQFRALPDLFDELKLSGRLL
ncbi:MAG: hypothetical protein C0510_02555 [Erythrobacter sp.]|nr:hypothetical protein [Erythrobacter sp.]